MKKKVLNEKVIGFRCVFIFNASLRFKKGEMVLGVSSNSYKVTGGVDVVFSFEVKFFYSNVFVIVCLF